MSKRPSLLDSTRNPEGFKVNGDAGKIKIRVDSRTEYLVAPEKVEAFKKKHGLT